MPVCTVNPLVKRRPRAQGGGICSVSSEMEPASCRGWLRRFMGDVLLIYLDYTATAPVEPAVLERFVRVERGAIGNPNSLHQAGRAAAAQMEAVTAHIASLLGVSPDALIYTSGASEANNLAVTINSPQDASPYILNLSVEGFRGAQLRDRLDERGFCVSVKSACSVENTPSRAVMAIARNRRRALSAFRVSLSHQTTEEELHAFLNTLDQLCKENPSCRAR